MMKERIFLESRRFNGEGKNILAGDSGTNISWLFLGFDVSDFRVTLTIS